MTAETIARSNRTLAPPAAGGCCTSKMTPGMVGSLDLSTCAYGNLLETCPTSIAVSQWTEPGSNRRPKDFQSFALPAELSVQEKCRDFHGPLCRRPSAS